MIPKKLRFNEFSDLNKRQDEQSLLAVKKTKPSTNVIVLNLKYNN